jgi:hypothetical protein
VIEALAPRIEVEVLTIPDAMKFIQLAIRAAFELGCRRGLILPAYSGLTRRPCRGGENGKCAGFGGQ